MKLLPAQRWRGLWHPGRHGGSFCASSTRESDDNESILLDWRDKLPGRFERELPEVGTSEAEGGVRYLMEFVGRRTSYPGIYGPSGNMHNHAVIIDRMIALRRLPEDVEE